MLFFLMLQIYYIYKIKFHKNTFYVSQPLSGPLDMKIWFPLKNYEFRFFFFL